MYIRVKTRPNTEKKAVQIVKSIRSGKKVNQKVVQTVGYAFDEETLKHLKNVAEHLKARLMAADQPTLFPTEEFASMAISAKEKRKQAEKKKTLMVNLEGVREEKRIITGIHEVYGQVYKLLNFDQVLSEKHPRAKEMLKHLTMARLAKPASNRASVAMLDEDFGITLNLNKVYSMMDKVNQKNIEKIQEAAYKTTKTLLNGKVRVIFYDCTTLYFESFKPDDLKQNGYSKDGKFNQPQVLLALLVTDAGLPIGYEVFPGATFEGNTLAPLLEKLKARYKLERIIFVADSGLLSEKNRSYLEKLGCEYILGARLKNLPSYLQKSVTNHDNYLPGGKIINGEKPTFSEFSHKGARLIVNHSNNRARKDEHDRLEAIKSLEKRLSKSKDPKSLLSNYGYKKYLALSHGSTSKLELNEEKIEEDAKWDGFKGVISNVKDLSKEELTSHYRNLWQIESCFRIQKHNLRIRPIFHWTPKRVHAHIAICFMAFTCQQYLIYRLRLQENLSSIEETRNALLHVQLSILKDQENGYCYGIPSKMNDKAKDIYKVLRLKYDITPFLIEGRK